LRLFRKKVYNEELHNLYSSPDIIRLIISLKMKWAVNMTRIREIKKHTEYQSGNLKGRNHLEDLSIDGL